MRLDTWLEQVAEGASDTEFHLTGWIGLRTMVFVNNTHVDSPPYTLGILDATVSEYAFLNSLRYHHLTSLLILGKKIR